VAVGVQGYRYRAVTQPLGDDLWMYPLLEQQRGVRVPQVVKPRGGQV